MRSTKSTSSYSFLNVLFGASILCLFFIIGCKDKTTSAESESLTKKQTQVILKTQPLPFDSSDITKITGIYVPTAKLEVPKDLVGQNKWIMFEGPVLENDVIAYRYYADGRHRYDIYGKKVSDLVMDTVSWQYHDIMDWGSDILKVGNSLGMGSPAIFYKDSVYTLSHWDRKTIEVLENGDTQSSIRTTFYGLDIDGNKIDLTEDWTLKAGSPWSEIKLTVINGSMPENAKFTAGIVKHLEAFEVGSCDQQTYCFSYGEQSFHRQNLGMAIIVPNEFKPQSVPNSLSHLLVFNGEKSVSYQFMANWAEGNGGVSTKEAFKDIIVKACGQ